MNSVKRMQELAGIVEDKEKDLYYTFEKWVYNNHPKIKQFDSEEVKNIINQHIKEWNHNKENFNNNLEDYMYEVELHNQWYEPNFHGRNLEPGEKITAVPYEKDKKNKVKSFLGKVFK